MSLFACSSSILGAKGHSSDQAPLNGEVQILQAWHGDVPLTYLDLLPEAQRENPVGYLSDAPTFKNVWDGLKPNNPAPDIDFKNHLVIYARNIRFYNRIVIKKINVQNGVAELLAMETRSARPIEAKVAISIVIIPRKGFTGLRSGETVLPVPNSAFE